MEVTSLLACEDTVFFLEGSHDLLPVTVDPASEHSDEHV